MRGKTTIKHGGRFVSLCLGGRQRPCLLAERASRTTLPFLGLLLATGELGTPERCSWLRANLLLLRLGWKRGGGGRGGGRWWEQEEEEEEEEKEEEEAGHISIRQQTQHGKEC